MMHQWQPDMVRFMTDACEYGDYNRRLVSEMAPYIGPDTHICDAGCGLGYLSLALAPHVKTVTAADLSGDALAVLRDNCRRAGIGNIRIYQGDIKDMAAPRPFDSMAFCFFGHIDEILPYAKRLCSGKVFLMKRNYKDHRFSVNARSGHTDTFSGACGQLEELGIPFVKKELALELGQPFRSLADAARFFQLYARDEDKSFLTEDFLGQRVRETGEAEFPFYMPHERKVGWITLDAQDIPA